MLSYYYYHRHAVAVTDASPVTYDALPFILFDIELHDTISISLMIMMRLSRG